ncbi:hypothetical protein EV421DRAFT_1859265 [Armillaria borealis]|uniref:Uncharacterized protein n=1 Tax=Armillaria borealis TaxID=47425 RepID=A0AA39IV93_9AGAR|nr:hypothetical protein EV421DRAFT_1859265 [Armillaria borealis]
MAKEMLFLPLIRFISSATSSTIAGRSTFARSLRSMPSKSKGPGRLLKSPRRLNASSTECLSRSYGCQGCVHRRKSRRRRVWWW